MQTLLSMLNFNASLFYLLFGATLLSIVLMIIINFLLKKLKDKAIKSVNTWDDLLIKSISLPIKVGVLYVWLYAMIIIITKHFILNNQLKIILNLIPLLLIIWLIFRFIDNVSRYVKQRQAILNTDSINLTVRLIKIFFMIIIAIMIAQYLGFSIASVLTFGGMGGLIIGFAAKDMLANIFGGLMLYIDKPFSTGDWIRSNEKNFEGVVEKIGWRMTKIRTFSKNPVYIPNAIFSNIHIETPSRMSNRRIKETIGVRYSDINQIPMIVTQIKNYLTQHHSIDANRTLMVNLNAFNAYSVDFFIYVFTKSTNWQEFHQTKEEVLLKVNEIIAENKAEIAYPTQVFLNQKLDE